MSSTYQQLATLRTKLTTTKQKERRQAFKELLELLSNNNTLKSLQLEAERTYSPNDKIYPSERVSILLRNILDASLVASQSVLNETKKKTANGTGYIKQSVIFTAEDVLFPQRVFLRIDGALECYTGYAVTDREDWKHRPRYCHHLDVPYEGYSATFYPDPVDLKPRSNLSSKEVLATVSYIISCLNNRDCCDLAEVELIQWLSHICCRPDYVVWLPMHQEISYVLHEISIRIYAEFSENGKKGTKSHFVGMHSNAGTRQVKQECLVACVKALSGLVYNTTTRLGMGMQLYLRPIVELVAWYAEHAWTYQSGGGGGMLASSSSGSSKQHRTELDIVSLMPHLYSTVTHLFAAHPEQSVAVLSETGHALLRLARKNYLKSATDPQLRDALTEYIGAHLLIAETSGKLYGLPEGDVGPLVIESPEEEGKILLGATLDKKAIDSLLEMVRDEKVWESLFASSEQDGKKNKPYQRSRFRSQKRKGGKALIVDGGGKWSPLNRNQRRYLELVVRLLRLSQRLYLAEVESLSGDVSSDPFETIMADAEQQQRLDIENGEIDVESCFQTSHDIDLNRQSVSSETLAKTPFVILVCQHLYSLNPKLKSAAASAREAADTLCAQSTLNMTQEYTQSIQESPGSKVKDVMPHEKRLLKSCPILRALVAKDSKYKDGSSSPTIPAILQIVCASAEAFPRGECWSSSARQNWTTALDESTYAGGASARVRERHGSFPEDAASVVYLLGSTLESCGGSGGDDDVQVWALMALLKMTESSAIICSRISGASSEALHVAWQYVWKVIFRYDVRYSSYTSSAHNNNAGELVLQLLTQIIRYECSGCSSFIQAQQTDILKLPVFAKPSAIVSGACFELVTALVQFTEVSIDSSTTMILPDISIEEKRDLKWIMSFCLKFIEHSLTENASESTVQRSFLPFAATCIASILSEGGIAEITSSFELDSLARFSVTEDTTCVCVAKRPEFGVLGFDASINEIHDILWRKAIVPYFHPSDSHGLEKHIGPVLNQYLDATREREKLCLPQSTAGNSSHCVHKHQLGDKVFDRIKTLFDEIIFGIRYGSDEEDESESENPASKNSRSDAPCISACLSLIMTAVLASRNTIKNVAEFIIDVAPGTIVRVLDYIPEVLGVLALAPEDLLSTMNHIHGVIRVLTHVAAASEVTSKIPVLLNDQLRAMFSSCKDVLRSYRHTKYAASSLELARPVNRGRHGYDSDNDFQTTLRQTQRFTQKSQFSDESDGFMDDAEDVGPVGFGKRATTRSAPPPKRRRVEKVAKANQDQMTLSQSMDCQVAWSCASLMITLNPSIECMEIITGHLVWPEDYDSENGYSHVTKCCDPADAIVCSSLFCQKQVILREHLLRSGLATKDKGEQSAVVLCVEVILQARRNLPPSSRYFMYGHNLLMDMIEFGDRSESSPSINAAESKSIVDALYPEGLNQDNEDYRLIRQWKKMIKFRSVYRDNQLQVSIGLFLRGHENVHNALDSIYSEYFIKSSFRQVDETLRARARDALGVALGGFPDQQMIVSEVNRSILPPLKSERKLIKWMCGLADSKTPVELSQLEQSALTDARLSFEFHAIDCVGLIAGSTTDENVCIEMIWKLLDLSTYEPAMGLLCRRACERAALMLGFENVSDLLSEMAPHLLVRWIESRRGLRDFPVLMTSPCILQIACRYLPNEVLLLLIKEGGWDDKVLSGDISNFVQSAGEYLVPIILLTKTDEASGDMEMIDASQYLSDYAQITLESTTDETFAKILRHHISDIFGYILVLSEHDNESIQEMSNYATQQLTGRISDTHIQRDGAKLSFMILRRILKLHAIGISVVGQKLDLTQTQFIEGMKSVSKHITQSSKGKFLDSAGSSLTELFIIAGHWLSSNGVSVRQKEKFWKPISLLCIVLQDQVRQAIVSPQELSFCMNFLVSTALNPKNQVLCAEIVQSLSDVLNILFYHSKDANLVDKVTKSIHKLCLALLTIHRRAFHELSRLVNSTFSGASYNKKCSIGVLSKLRDADSSSDEVNTETGSFDHHELKNIIKTRANGGDDTLSNIMAGAYDCLDSIVNSGKISLDDIVGADDIVTNDDVKRKRAFGDLSEKYEVEHLFNSIRRGGRSVLDESRQFLQIMEQYPVSSQATQLESLVEDAHSVNALARLLALRRLEKSLATETIPEDAVAISRRVMESLISICQSNDSMEAKVISSKCLGGFGPSWAFAPAGFIETQQRENTGDDLLLVVKVKALSMVGQFILCGSPDIALIAMKTAKTLLSTSDGKECWNILQDDEMKGILKPFLASALKQDKSNGGFPQKEKVELSKNYIKKLHMITGGSSETTNWCWNDGLWTSLASGKDSWVQKVVGSIIVCRFGKESKLPRCSFICNCQGLIAKDSKFASCMFPAIIYFLLDSESGTMKYDKHSIRDVVNNDISIGSPMGEMNNTITRCICNALRSFIADDESFSDQYAVRVVLETLEALLSVTMQRFITSAYHKKNTADVPKEFPSGKRKSAFKSQKIIRKWRGVPFGITLKLDGLDVATACRKAKQYYSAIYFCEMAMQNYSGVGNFLEYIATDSITSSDAAWIGDISGFGIEIGNDNKKSLLELALRAKDILAKCLAELRQNDELEGVLYHASALSLKQSMTTLESVHESHSNQPFPTLQHLDVDLQTGCSAMNVSSNVSRVVTCLEDLGLDHVKQHYMKGTSSLTSVNEKWFEDALMQTSQWDDALLKPLDDNALAMFTQGASSTFAVDSLAPALGNSAGYNESIYHALQNLVRNDVSGSYSAVARAREAVLNDIGSLNGLESNLSMPSYLIKLKICDSLTYANRTVEGETTLSSVLKHWGFEGESTLKTRLLELDESSLDIRDAPLTNGDFFRLIRLENSVKEVLISLLLRHFPQDRYIISDALTGHIYESCRRYRHLGRVDAAKHGLSRLRYVLKVLDTSHSVVPLALRLEDAKVMAYQNDFGNAITHCKTIANYSDNFDDDDADLNILLARTLLLGGCFMTHEHVDSVSTMESFFERAAKLSQHAYSHNSNSSSLSSAVAYFKLGEFASSIYSSIDARVSSEVWIRRKASLIEREKELAVLKSEYPQLERKHKRSNKQTERDALIFASRRMHELPKEIGLDQREINSSHENLHKYLGMALKSYCNALKLCPTTATSLDYSKHIFKLIGLWFENSQRDETQDAVNVLLRDSIFGIPTYHFIQLLYQIFSRIDNTDSPFQNTLHKLVTNIATEHPYHSIPQLIALSNGNLANKVEAAKSVIGELQKNAPKYVSGLIETYGTLMDAYIALAMATKEIPKDQTKGFTFSKLKLKLDVCLYKSRRGATSELREHAPAIITKPPSIRPDAHYGFGIEDPIGTERVVGFESSFELAPSGLHRPAIIICQGSKGGRFKQLVKGDDDMRQDAVMQQVFGTMNGLLGNEDVSRAHSIHEMARIANQQLKVITYGIAPLNPKAGVLEWLNDTISFGHFMNDTNRENKRIGAPSRYCPGEWSNAACREYYSRNHSDLSQEQRREVFDTICSNISPGKLVSVLLHRELLILNGSMAYGQNSLHKILRFGHVLGIGDRHTSNILIDTKTGELAHIDFGFVFEQAKLLPTPETVPFRLTRNIVDGMGPCGTEGVFSKSAEATLAVLRKNADTVQTILSAIVSDTLDRWSPSWSSSLTDDNKNEAAARAMTKVHDKLQGYEDGTSGMHNVTGQVKFLINEARDPNNLCNLFTGWQPWI